MSITYQGSCHCGDIKFTFESEEIKKGLRCTCSMCVRKGALMLLEAIPPERIHVDTNANNLGVYQFGIKTAKHYFCKNCGIYTFHETARKVGHFRVNLGCVNGIDPLALDVEVFDGKNLL